MRLKTFLEIFLKNSFEARHGGGNKQPFDYQRANSDQKFLNAIAATTAIKRRHKVARSRKMPSPNPTSASGEALRQALLS